MKKYFDFHFHPSFKPYMSGSAGNERLNCWDYISSWISIVRSQSCLDQAVEGGVRLGVANFIALERPLTTNLLIEHLAPIITILDKQAMHFRGEADYFARFKEEVTCLMDCAERDPANGKTFQVLRGMEDYDPDKLNLIFAIEGGHNLEQYNTNILDNFRELKRGPFSFLYLTLVHLVQQSLATHAYGMKLIKNNDEFKPAGRGLTQLGKAVIKMAYETELGPRVLIDLKHMSLTSRQDFYEYRRQQGYDNIPILATHMGVTGISWRPEVVSKYFKGKVRLNRGFVQVEYSRPRGIGVEQKTFFNPWSVNLYDEDITEILDSDGMIGLNLDQRILGTQRAKGEFFSAEEFAEQHPDVYHELTRAGARKLKFKGQPPSFGSIGKKKTRHLRHLCNNILHIVKVGGPRAWQQICIGSDFDGLINPVDNCSDATQFEQLEEDLFHMLPQMMLEDASYNYDMDNVAQKVRGILYENGIRFLQKHFRKPVDQMTAPRYERDTFMMVREHVS